VFIATLNPSPTGPSTFRLARVEALEPLLDDEPRHPAVRAPVGVGDGEDDEHVRDVPVGDVGLVTLQDPAAARRARVRPDRPRVRPRLRFGERVGGEQVPGGERDEVFLLLRLAAGEVDRHRSQTFVSADRHGRRVASPGDLLEQEAIADLAEAGTAVFLGEHDPQEPELRRLADDVERRLLLLVDFGRPGPDHLVGEAAGHVPQHLLFFGERKVDHRG
jgi:hypothetical protein